jgi:hypothetical protein
LAAEVEAAAGELVDVELHHAHAAFKVDRHAAQIVGIDLDAGALHVQQDGDEAALKPLVEHQRMRGAQARVKREPEAQRHVGVLGGVVGGLRDRDGGEGDAVAPGAGDGVVGDGRVPEMQRCEFIQAVAMQAGFVAVGNHHCVVEGGDRREAVAQQHQHVELGVLHHHEDAGIGEQRAEGGDH